VTAPERALKTAIYVEERARKKQIKGSAGGYARTVSEKGSDIGMTQVDGEQAQKKKEASAEREKERAREDAADARAKQTTAAIKALSLDERRELAEAYLADGGKGKTYQQETATFKDAVERTAFTAWLRATISSRANARA
jgi:hypothetical protein